MVQRLGLLLLTVLVSASAWAGPASAQVYTGIDATLASRYVWRGVTRVNHWVVQPEAYLGLGVAGGFLSAGVWANNELGRAGAEDLSDLGPGGSGWGEVDYWASYSRRAGLVDASVAFMRYTYRGEQSGLSRTSAANTSEVYGSLRLSSKYFAPRVAAYFDIDRVRGTYLEASGTIPVFGNPLGAPFWALYVQGLIGYNLGQEVSLPRPGEAANFAGSGVTHLDLSLSGNVSPTVLAAPTVVHLEFHVQFNNDDFTRRTSGTPTDANASVKSWLTLSIRWEHAW
jgi:hypothetical protein